MVIVVHPVSCCAMTTRRCGDVAIRSRKSVGWKADPVDYYLSSALFLFLRLLSFCYYRGLSHSPAIHRTTFYGSTFGSRLQNSDAIWWESIVVEPRWTMMLLPNSTTPTDIDVCPGLEFYPEWTCLVHGVSAILLWVSEFGSIVAIGRICYGTFRWDWRLDDPLHDTSQSSELPVIWPRKR
jgi:hypothetical protein